MNAAVNAAAWVDSPDPLARHEQGRKIYNYRCYFCHGYSGNARTLAASFLDPKPRDFTRTVPTDLTREGMLNSVRDGKPGSAMQGFVKMLTGDEISLVVDFVRLEFMQRRALNTTYHTEENGWPNHARYQLAFPFALGELALDTPDQELTAAQLAGKRVFMNGCVSCHDRARVESEGIIWDTFAVSFPRNQYSHQASAPVDTMSRSTPFSQHEKPPAVSSLSPTEKSGELLFQKNCAFCHAADGSGKNWIGSFLQPHPRDLSNTVFMASLTETRLRNVIEEGLPGSTMSAWKGVLSPRQIDELVAYIKRAFPAIGAAGKR